MSEEVRGIDGPTRWLAPWESPEPRKATGAAGADQSRGLALRARSPTRWSTTRWARRSGRAPERRADRDDQDLDQLPADDARGRRHLRADARPPQRPRRRAALRGHPPERRLLATATGSFSIFPPGSASASRPRAGYDWRADRGALAVSPPGARVVAAGGGQCARARREPQRAPMLHRDRPGRQAVAYVVEREGWGEYCAAGRQLPGAFLDIRDRVSDQGKTGPITIAFAPD